MLDEFEQGLQIVRRLDGAERGEDGEGRRGPAAQPRGRVLTAIAEA
ncbi:hypothetical protein [Kitasatospora griseola]